MKTATDLLETWFEGLGQADTTPLMQRWFGPDPERDARLQADFGDLLAQAEAGGLQEWETHAETLLALVVLLDQFSRNLHRGSARAFGNDQRARELARKALEQGWDQQLVPMQSMFLYLPFEHSEDPADQELAVSLFEALSASAPAEQQAFFDSTLDYARRHRDVIARFGRFPHRNARLERPSTPAEELFLQQPGASFG